MESRFAILPPPESRPVYHAASARPVRQRRACGAVPGIQESMMKKFVVAVLFMASTLAYADRSVDELYPKTCSMCHAAAVAGAPKTGDLAVWKPRLDAKGIDGLLQSVHSGLNAMPPKGMCMDCTDTEYKALIEFMMKPAS
jgi:cytochrome c5